LIVFNPPSYFYVRKPDLSSPAASGVYTGDARTALDINESLMFQFFKKLVLPLLTPGGDVICTWPGLKRRVVEVNPVAEKRGPAAHPADVLESWLDITIECPDRNVDRFYRHTAVVNIDYGLGSSFWSNLDHALQNPRCYSTLVKPADWKHGNHPTFRFGVLRLRRAESDPNRFEASPGEGGANE